jgi:hypothetical protein
LGKGTPGLWDISTKLAREESLVVELALYPGHEQLDVLWSRHFKWSLNVLSIRPQVLELLARTHDRTRVFSAELCKGAVKDRNLVVELNRVHGQPLIEVLTGGQLHGQRHVAATQSHLCDLL